MALGRGKDTLPFQLAVQEETNPPKREVSSGQEALLTPSAGVPSCPPPTSPKQSPHPTRNFQIFRSPGLHQSSLNPFQTSSSPPSRLTRFLPHTHTEASSNLDQPKHTPRLPKQRHRPATLGGSSPPPPPVPAHFLPGRVGGGRDPLLSGQAHPHSPGAAGRSLTHPEDAAALGRTPRAGGGSATGRGGAGAGKASCSYRDARPGARPPSPRAPLVLGPSPAPWARPGSPAPIGLRGPALLPPTPRAPGMLPWVAPKDTV